MGNIQIVTDSTIDLSEEERKALGIHIVPLNIYVKGQSYTDRVDLEPDQFLDLMREADELPKSSQPAVGVFKELYDELGRNGDEILSIHMTGGMSGTVKAAQQAAQLTEAKVTVIDSTFISFGLQFQVREAVEYVKKGKTMEEIVAHLDEVRKRTTLFVVVDTLDNLVKGGRIGKGRAMLGSLLNIKPIAMLQEGVYAPVGKARSHKQVVTQLLKAFEEDTAGKKVKGVGIAHANGLKMGQPLQEQLEARGHEVPLAFTTPIISTHTGEGAIGFMYYTED